MRAAAAGAALAAALPGVLRAQGAWDADLMVDPFPSPYASDWEANPQIASLTVFNNTGADASVRLTFSLTGQTGTVVATGTSDPQLLPDGPTVFDSPFDLSGSFDYDVSIQDGIVRTGRLPEGDYQACTAVTNGSGFVLAEACSPFSVVYPDPPMLLAPFDGDRVTSQDVFFEWTPLQVPFEYPVTFVLQIAEVLPGQSAEHALSSNIPQYQDGQLTGTHLQYPLGALPFEPGRRYAWRVQALDQNAYPVSANNGASEIWTFEFADEVAGVAAVRVSPSAARFTLAGDTARLVARAFDDADFELPDLDFEWTSTDTTVATVDSAGVITSAGIGRAQIIATLDGVADTVPVSTGETAATLRVRFYDPDTETPELYTLLESGSFEEVADRLEELLERGEFELPLPGLPGMETDAAGAPGGGGDAGAAVCPTFETPFYVARDLDRKSLAIGMRSPEEVGNSLLGCLGVPELWPNRPGQRLEALFVFTRPDRAPPQVTVGLKIPLIGLLGDGLGPYWEYAVIVLNPWRGFELDPAKSVPDNPEVAAFYPHKFEVKGLDVERERETGDTLKTETKGMGALTFYARLNMAKTPIAGLLDALGFEEPVIELEGDFSTGADGGLIDQRKLIWRDSTSAAPETEKTFVIRGKLPKRAPLNPVVAAYVDAMQLGIELEIEYGADSTKVTPKLVHTIELDLPLPDFPPIELEASVAWEDVAPRPDSTSHADSSAAHSETKWVLEYEVSSKTDSLLVLWDRLQLKLGAEIGYLRSTTKSPAEWEVELTGTGGFDAAPEMLAVSVKYGRESANCGGTDEPPCPEVSDSSMESLQPPPLTKKQKDGEWALKLASKGPVVGTLAKGFKELLQYLWQKRPGVGP